MLPVESPFKTYTGLDGKPLDGGYVYFGQPNQNPITAPVTVYWDAAGTQPAAQPLRTANGYIMRSGTPANVFYSADYSELVQDSKRRQVCYARTSTDFSIGTVVLNFITSLASSIGASLIGSLQAGANAILRTVQDRLYDDVYLTDFMSTAQKADTRPGTGSIDVSGAIQSMINSVSRSSRFIIPPGYYKVSSTITFPPNLYLFFEGAGMGATTFEFYGTGNAFESSSLVSNTQKTSFQGFTLVNHPGNTNATNGIYLRNGQYWSNIEDVFVDGFSKTGTQTYNGLSYYYAGIFAIDSWGAEWDRVMLRHNGVGLNLVQCTGTYKNLDIQANVQHGAFIEDSPATIIGGVFEGNSTIDNGNAASTTQNAEIYLMGGETKVIGAFIEGEGVNPPWSVVINGRSALSRAFGGGIMNCPINRSRDTSFVRGCIKLDYVEEPVIQGNSIMPTGGGAGAAAIPHINITPNAKNPKVGRNTWRGRHWYVGSFYANVCPVLLPAEMAALTVPYTFDSVGGGLTTELKRLSHAFLLPGPLAAPTAETVTNCNGGTQTHSVWVERLSWLTGVILTNNAGLAAGTVTVRIYNRVNGAGALVLLKTFAQGTYANTSKILLSQHPYITRVDAGHIVVTVETDGAFAPTAGSEVTVQVLIEEDDSH